MSWSPQRRKSSSQQQPRLNNLITPVCIPYLFQEPAENLVLTQLGMSSHAQQKYLKQDASKVSYRIWGKMMRCKRCNNNNCFTDTRHVYFTETERHMYFTETELDWRWTELYTTPAFETELDLKWTELYTTPAFETELDLKWTELYTTPAFATELDLKWTELYTTPAFETELDLKWTELYTTPAFAGPHPPPWLCKAASQLLLPKQDAAV